LHYAASEKAADTAQQLVTAGADPNATDDEGWTPLHFAAQSNSAELIRLLLQAGAVIDPRDSFGNTPLFKAVFNSRGDGNVIALLRAHGADPHASNARGISPLKLARTIANFDVRQFFCDLPEITQD